MITKEDALKIGFKSIGHFTVGDNLHFDLGRDRQLSISCLGTPNEMVFLCQLDNDNLKVITDLVCIHNYDYDGFLTIDRLLDFIKLKAINL